VNRKLWQETLGGEEACAINSTLGYFPANLQGSRACAPLLMAGFSCKGSNDRGDSILDGRGSLKVNN
jgi:hypothetical protein